VNNDTVYLQLGQLVNRTSAQAATSRSEEIVARRGNGRVRLVQYANGAWRLFVDNKPFQVRGISYSPTRIGESPHNGTLRNWMLTDDNNNGMADSPYDAYLDNNKNNSRDNDEPVIGDFQLLHNMGANTIRYYHVPPGNRYNSAAEFDKTVLRDLYKRFSIRVIIGDFLGAYTVGSGADWETGTDYRDEAQQKRMLECVRNLVLDHKDEDYVLMWVLGNENNMSNQYGGVNATKTLAAVYPEVWARFLNRTAKMIHAIDPDHPVMVGNLETQLVEYYRRFAPELDIIGINSYRGKEGFGDIFYYIRRTVDRPVIITEFGCDVVDFQYDTIIVSNEESQREYLRGTWRDITGNLAGADGAGNCLGGVVFEWLDEWWKSPNGPWDLHDITRDSPMAFQDRWSSEEFLGIMSQGEGTDSPYLRQPRQAYYFLRDEWNR
jgi:beta-glucuronidase